MATSESYSPAEVLAMLTIQDMLTTAFIHNDDVDADIPDDEIGEIVKVSATSIFKVLIEAGIDDEDFMENEFEEVLPEKYSLNCDGPNYWLS